MDDHQLLRQYLDHGSQEAFAELVNRYVGLVYSAALRQIGDAHQADDLTQTIFLTLAQKAGRLGSDVILSCWLLTATRYAAANARRSHMRRQYHEKQAAEMAQQSDQSSNDTSWAQIAPELDDAIAILGDTNRVPVVLRYFEGQSIAQVSQRLGITEGAVKQRVSRGLEQLRSILVGRGVTVPLVALEGLLLAHALQPAPAGLAAAATTTATASTLAATETARFTLIKGAMAIMATAKTKSLALVVALLLFGSAAGVIVYDTFWNSAPKPAAGRQPTQPVAANTQSPAIQAPTGLSVRGTVRTPDGKPLSDARVRLATQQSFVSVYYPFEPAAAVATTSVDGTFALTTPAAKSSIVINSPAGYAVVTPDDLEANRDVVVQPWGRVDGVLVIGTTPAANRTVNLSIWGSSELWDWYQVSHNASTRTDATGRFVFPQVAPGDIWVSYDVEVRPGDARQNGHVYAKVLPGPDVITNVQLGGKGRPVVGKLVWDSDEKLYFYGSMWRAQDHNMRVPPDWKAGRMNDQQKRAYEREWRNSPEGELFKREVRNYEFSVKPDGTFEVPDVIAGRYDMHIRAERKTNGKWENKHAAIVETHIRVPAMPDGRSDEPLDVGLFHAQAGDAR